MNGTVHGEEFQAKKDCTLQREIRNPSSMKHIQAVVQRNNFIAKSRRSRVRALRICSTYSERDNLRKGVQLERQWTSSPLSNCFATPAPDSVGPFVVI